MLKNYYLKMLMSVAKIFGNFATAQLISLIAFERTLDFPSLHSF